MGRASKGTVKVEVLRGRLRLVWSWNRQRFFLSMGLPDSPPNRAAAEFKARLIERDIAAEVFDPTLRKYKQVELSSLSALELWQKFTGFKARTLDPRTIEKYGALERHIRDRLADKPAALSDVAAEAFWRHLEGKLAGPTLLDRLSLLKACWTWGIKQGLVEANPWTEFKVKAKPTQSPRPFTLEQIQQIRSQFRSHRHYSYYADYVDFLFGTGCRTGEAIGLKWRHVAPDFRSVWIGEILTLGQRKKTKTGKDRTVPLTPSLQAMLRRRWGDGQEPDSPVFLSATGKPVNAHDFREDAWMRILGELGIEYRKPYLSRSTLISHALESGMNPVDVATLVGNRVDTIYRNYAGVIKKLELPDLLAERDTIQPSAQNPEPDRPAP